MNTKGLLSSLAGLAGVALALLPWMYFEKPSWGTYIMTCVGAVLAGISRSDSLAQFVGRGNPGDEFLREIWADFMKLIKRR